MTKKQKFFLFLSISIFLIGILICLYFFFGQNNNKQTYQNWKIDLDLPQGQISQYLFSLKTNQSSPHLAFGDVSAQIDLRGLLTLEVLERRDKSFLMAFSFNSLDEKVFSILGKNILSDEKQIQSELFSRRFFFELEKSGKIKQVFIPKEGRKLLELLAPYVLTRLQLASCHHEDMRICKTWEDIERGSYGQVLAKYTSLPEEGSLKKKYERYLSLDLFPGQKIGERFQQKLNGVSHYTLDSKTYYLSVDHSEYVEIRKTDNSLLLRGNENFSMKLLKQEMTASLPMLSFNENDYDKTENLISLQSKESERKLLVMRVNGLSEDQFMGALSTYAIIGSADHLPNWFYRASGLLLLKPELCQKLRVIFKNSEKFPLKRNVIIELLAAAGSIEAEKAIIDIFGENTMSAEVWSQTFQRISFLDKPSKEIIKMVIKKNNDLLSSSESREKEFEASLYTLGSLISSYAVDQNKEEAEEYAEELLRFSPKTIAEEKILINALGNAGLSKLSDEIISQTNHSDQNVRAAAAFALRKMNDNRSLQVLAGLIVDDVEVVQLEAIRALSHQSSDFLAYPVARICRGLVSDKHFKEVVINELLSLLESFPDLQEGRPCLEYISKNKHLAGTTRNRAQIALERMK